MVREVGVCMWNNSLPLYKQIANKIKDDILSANLSHGDAIPTESKLTQTYGASRVTIRQAIKLLVEEGMLYKVQGSGTYISHDKIEHNISKLQGFTEEMDLLQNNPSNKILAFELTSPSEEVKKILRLGEGEQVYYVKRLRLADNEPLVMEESYLPVNLFPDLSIDVMKNSKYEYIVSRGFKIDKRYGEILPTKPDWETMEYFNLMEEDSLLLLEAYSTFTDGKVFEFSRIYYHPYKYSFKVVSEKK